ncbi:MAG: histidine phosphatase family protein [Oscillospiraceae bacterium]|nr:histidine phosphatase family protein [Oscillospiraceae bacterium]
MKNVYLIRHGLPDFPGGKGMCIGTTDIPMGEKGLSQAAEMAKNLPPVTAVFSSPLTRAVQTAQAIGLPVTVLPDLREMYAGEWDGLTFEQIRTRYPELYAARFHDLTIPLPGAEDHAEGLSRFKRAMEEAARKSPGDFAVVAHGGIIAQFLQDISGVWKKPDYTQIIPLIYTNGTFFVDNKP